MDNYKKLIVFLSLYFSFCLSAEADYLDELGLRNNDPKMIGKIASLKYRNVEDSKVELAFAIVLENLEDSPKKIVLAYTKDCDGLAPRIGLFAYVENDWIPLEDAMRYPPTSFVVPGKSQKKIEFVFYIPPYAQKHLNSLLKLYISGYKISPTDWGKSIEIDFRIKIQDVPKIMGQ